MPTTTAALLFIIAVLAIGAIMYALSRTPAPPDASRARSQTAQRPGTIYSWGYQLQNLDIAHAAAGPFDLLVVDPAKDGSDDSGLTAIELDRLKTKPDGGRRLVLAYLSIGEAESYRGYWNPDWTKHKPAWLLRENPEWDENYAVCFWDPGWQAIMCGSPDARLDRIIAAGFDGVYLDKCDVFEDMREQKMKEATARPDLEGDMVSFIQRLSKHGKARNPGFLVVMQNAESLLDRAEVRKALDGVAKEELVFGLDGPEKRNDPEAVDWSRKQLDLVKREGKFVLVVEYLGNARKIDEARQAIAPLGYTLAISPKDRALKALPYPPAPV